MEPSVRLWPGAAPGESEALPPESDVWKFTDQKVAGAKIVKLANVSTPLLEVYPAPAEIHSGTAVIVCPGGGHNILAYDLEGTEVAEWLNSIGVTAFVLKYRVPAREPDRRWRAAVEDAQRAVSVVRAEARTWGVDPARIGMLGFSAGGEAAALTSAFGERRTYDAVDDLDRVPCRPDFAVLVYPAWLVEDESGELRDYVTVDEHTPAMFLVQASDDPISPRNGVALFSALRRHGVSAELHVYSRGGHGYGLRETSDPITTWPARCEDWLRAEGWIGR